MKAIYILLLLKTFVLALMFDNPHEIDPTGKNINDDICKTCHLSFNGGYSGYFASIYKPTMQEYSIYLASIYKPTMQEYSIYLASLNNFHIDNLKTAGTNSETSDESFTAALPISSSGLCLSCHNGVDAMNVNHQATLNANIDGGHPISIEYIEGNSKLRSKESIINNWDNAYTINDILVNEKVECVSCHNPHNKTNMYFLRSTNIGSKLCITCHNK